MLRLPLREKQRWAPSCRPNSQSELARTDQHNGKDVGEGLGRADHHDHRSENNDPSLRDERKMRGQARLSSNLCRRVQRGRQTMSRLPIPSDGEEFSEETRSAVRHIQATRRSMPPPSSYLTYAGRARGASLGFGRTPSLSHLADRCRNRAGDLHGGAGGQRRHSSGTRMFGWA